jgi:hypothetical protein
MYILIHHNHHAEPEPDFTEHFDDAVKMAEYDAIAAGGVLNDEYWSWQFFSAKESQFIQFKALVAILTYSCESDCIYIWEMGE